MITIRTRAEEITVQGFSTKDAERLLQRVLEDTDRKGSADESESEEPERL